MDSWTGRLTRITFWGLSCLGLMMIVAACVGQPGPVGPPGPQGLVGPTGLPGKDGLQGPEGKSFIAPGPGLKVKITAAEFPPDGKPVISLNVTDDAGTPLAIEAIEGYGFTIAQIVVDETTELSKYQNLLVREVEGKPYTINGETKQPALAKATQAFAENGGSWSGEGNGNYTYTFANPLTSAVDPTATTTVAVYAYKDGRATVVNDTYTFVPAGGEPSVTRQVVSTTACQTCHNPLQAHGGVRRETALCITCHTDQTTDPETGNSVDFEVLIHRLHSGARLPSVIAGTPYQIIGYRQSLNDFSKGTWPQDTRNCTTCHAGGAQADNYKTMPNTTACTACHDDVNPTTGQNHPGGIADDAKCPACHISEGGEFDTSITGAHLLPIHSSKIRGVNFEIISVEVSGKENSPTITFKVTDNAGETISPTDMDYLAVTFAGPTSDYIQRVTETIFRKTSDAPQPAKVEDLGGGVFRYTFMAELPPQAMATYAFSIEGYVMEKITGLTDPVRVTGFNPVSYLALDGSQPAPRRQVVARERCNACHANLALHGTIRQNPEYCVMCHNPMATDEVRRPAEALPPTTINFRVLIHGIHRGEELNQKPFSVYGFSGQPINFSDIVFPGNLAACETCHLPATYALPLPEGIQPTTITQAGTVLETILPIRSVCTACHDSVATAGHAELQTTAAGIETCEVCHGPGKEFDVAAVHR